MKCRTHMDCHAVVFAVFYRARLHYACAEAGKFKHFGKGNFVKLTGVRHNARVSSVNAVHIGINIADACIKPAAMATAVVSLPPRPRVVISPLPVMP